MPVFRGIDLAVVASDGAKKLPEYPHPEGSSVRLVAAEDLHGNGPLSPKASETSILSESDPTRQKKVHPVISVYIPSMPGEQFWLKYHILRPPPQASHLFFKMFLNGAFTTSWGMSLSTEEQAHPSRPITGTVVRALYEPGEKWRDERTGAEFKHIGIETRYFHFIPGSDRKSIAEDGGLIEVRVFRSKGRRRRIPKMAGFRNQERYGIASPSGGLVENPQDATYYDWLLVDPKNAPYATFNFHYRSMRRLVQLSLIPRSDSRSSLPHMAPGSADNNVESHSVSPGEEVDVSAAQFAFGINLAPGAVPNETAVRPGSNSSNDATPDGQFRCNPLQLIPTGSSGPLMSQSSTAHRDVITPTRLQRPLPDPPKAESRRSSHSSLRSNCPSLTPSLAQYVDNGEFGTDEISIGLAHTVLPAAPSMVSLSALKGKVGEKEDDPPLYEYEKSKGENVDNEENEDNDENEEDISISDYENSTLSSGSFETPVDLPSPCNYLSTTGSVLERHIAQISSPVAQPSSRLPASAAESALVGEQSAAELGTLRLSESEWIRHTPSPVQRRSFLRMWSPRVEKKSPKYSPDGIRQQKRHCDVEGRYSFDLKARDPVRSTALTGVKGRQCSPETPAIKDHGIQQGQEEYHGAHRARRHDSLDAAPAEKRSTWESCRDAPDRARVTGEYLADNWI